MSAKRFKHRLDQLRFDRGFPLSNPISFIFVAGVFVRKRRFEREAEGKRFVFLVHKFPVVAIR